MIRVLHIVGSMERNGLQTFIMNIYRKIDREAIQFDFIEFRNKPCAYDAEIEALGGRIYRLPSKSGSFLKCLSGIAKIVRENNYQIVHRHYYSASMVVELLAAKAGGAKELVAHSHSTRALHRAYMHYLCRPLLNIVATRKIACSAEAGKWMYSNNDYSIVNNCIDVDNYTYSEEIRQEIREKYGISESTFLIGNVARFDKVKNHEYMIDILAKYKLLNTDVMLMFVGDGSRLNEMKEYARQKSVYDSVIFLGDQNDVSSFLQAFDVFILPSLYEGIPLTLVEAQANGLKCIVSSNVDKRVDLTGNVEYEEITEAALIKWCEHLTTISKKRERDFSVKRKLFIAGYSSEAVARTMEDFYGECNTR